MSRDMEIRIMELALGGGVPAPAAGTRSTKLAGLAVLGWRILPIPTFWAEWQLWHDEEGGGNLTFIDFDHAREWLVVPPDGLDTPARKVSGRVAATRWAWAKAMGAKSGTGTSAFRIEVDRHGFLTERASSTLSDTVTRQKLIAELPPYCLQYRHRLLIDGEVVAEAELKETPAS